MRHFYIFLVALFISNLGFGQTLSAGDLAIIGLSVDDEEALIVALEDIPSGESVFFTDDEWGGASFNSGEGFYEWVTPAITAGTVFTIDTSGTSEGGTVTQRAGSFALANSGDGFFLYQTSTNVYNTGTYTLLGFAGEDISDAGTLAGTGLVLGTNAIYYAGDNGIYVGVRTGEDKAGYLSLIYGSSWTTSGNSQTFDLTDFTFATGCTAPFQASSYQNLSIGTTDATVRIVRGGGDDVLVVMREGSAVDADPNNGISYMANSVFGAAGASEIGTGNFVVFNGNNGTSNPGIGGDILDITVTGLTPNTTYHFAFYEYNTVDTCYNLDELAESFTTDSAGDTASDIIENPSFTYTTDIPYVNLVNNGPLTDGNSVELAQFTIQDGNGGADGLSTILSDIELVVSNPANLDRIAVFDGLVNVQELDAAAIIMFTNLALEANNNDIKIFSIRASFNSIVTDNEQIGLQITAASAQAVGSVFTDTDAGGATSSATDNFIEVNATQLLFTQEPPNSIIVSSEVFNVIVEAQDANGNIDLDYSNPVTLNISTGGTLNGTTNILAFGGVVNFSDLSVSTFGTYTLEASGTLTTAVSASFDVTEPSFIFEDFDDGNFTSNPSWTGNTAPTEFNVITNPVIPDGNASTDGSYLASNSNQSEISLAVASTEVTEWRFSIASPDFDPSSSNNFGVVLMASSAFTGDLTSNNFQGYYLRLGVNGSTDRLQLWRKTGAGQVNIGDFPSSPDFGSGSLQDGLNIRITRSAIGEFELFYETGFDYSTDPITSAGTLTDNSYSTSLFFGVFQNFPNISTSRRIYFDNLDLGASPTNYTFDGSWSPSDPSGMSTSAESIIVASGDATISASTDINTVSVNPGASLTIDAGIILTIADPTAGLTLESTSSSFSSLINNGSISGTVNYERFVNQIGQSGVPGGNDLISAPLGAGGVGPFALIFQTFLGFGSPANSSLIASLGNIYAFAPFNTASAGFENISFDTNFPPPPANQPIIEAGKGYRVATSNGANLTFTGAPLSGDASIAISTAASQWNLIGNPYPSYISSALFLSTNTSLLDETILDPEATAIYGYNSGNYVGDTGGNTALYTIINANTNSGLNIAPGQGFFVASNATGGAIQFTPAMQTTTGMDDFIVGRSSSPNYKLILELQSAQISSTSFFFNQNSTRGLDPGYDAAVFGENVDSTPLFSHLVEDNTGRAMAMQSLGESDFSDVLIPLGVNANQGTQLRFAIAESSLPSTTEVYLEDQVANTSTLLNTSDYVLTPNSNLSGTGRFFLRFGANALSTADEVLDAINIFTDQSSRSIVITGHLVEATSAKLFDLQGRLITHRPLKTNTTSQSIALSNLSSGIYVVQLESANQTKTQKVILK